MSCEPLGSALPLFSASYSSRTSPSSGRLGGFPFHKLMRDCSRAAGDSRAIHRPEIRLDLHHHHGPGRLRVCRETNG